MYVGGGCVISGASEELVEVSEKMDIPVACSMMGLGCFPASHPNFMGMIGMHGKANVAEALEEADLIIAIGCRFDDRVAGDRKNFCKQAKIVHIDIDLAELGKNVKPDVAVMADAKLALRAMLPVSRNRRTAAGSSIAASAPKPIFCSARTASSAPAA